MQRRTSTSHRAVLESPEDYMGFSHDPSRLLDKEFPEFCEFMNSRNIFVWEIYMNAGYFQSLKVSVSSQKFVKLTVMEKVMRIDPRRTQFCALEERFARPSLPEFSQPTEFLRCP